MKKYLQEEGGVSRLFTMIAHQQTQSNKQKSQRTGFLSTSYQKHDLYSKLYLNKFIHNIFTEYLKCTTFSPCILLTFLE